MNKVVFVDNIGRTILGEENKKKSTKTQLAVDNPTIVFVQPNPDSGQIQVQVIPLFFRELATDESREGSATWLFPRNTLTTNANLVPDEKLISQWDRVIGAGPDVPPGIVVEKAKDASDAPKVVKLFDEAEDAGTGE